MSQPVTMTNPAIEKQPNGAVTSTQASPGSAIEARPNGPTTLTPEERHRLIAETSYFMAASRGFLPGHELDDWLEAERQVDWAWTDVMGFAVEKQPVTPRSL